MREYLQHVVSVTVISSAHIKGNSIFGKMLILWEIQGKYKKKKTNARHHRKLIHQNPDKVKKLCAKCCEQARLERDFLPRLIRVQ